MTIAALAGVWHPRTAPRTKAMALAPRTIASTSGFSITGIQRPKYVRSLTHGRLK